MSRDTLTANVISAAHDPSQTDRCNTVFIPAAEARIGSELKSKENEAVTVLTLVDGQSALPEDYGSYHKVFIGNLQTGREIPFEIFAEVFYSAEASVNFWYWQRPAALVTGASTNAVLQRWPDLYQYAVLLELQIWKQDSEQITLANEAYNDEVGRINRQAARGRGDKPQMRRA